MLLTTASGGGITEKTNGGVGMLSLDAAGIAATETTVTWANTGDDIFFVSNQSGGNRVATLKSQTDPFERGGSADTQNDEAITIPTLMVGLFPFADPAMFNSGGLATVTLDATTSTKVGVIRIRKTH